MSVVPLIPEEQIANGGSQDVIAGATGPSQTTKSAGCPLRNTLPSRAFVVCYYTSPTFRTQDLSFYLFKSKTLLMAKGDLDLEEIIGIPDFRNNKGKTKSADNFCPMTRLLSWQYSTVLSSWVLDSNYVTSNPEKAT